MRLFAALVPPPVVIDHAELALDQVRMGPAAALRWVPRENLHLTLAFLGETPEGATGDVIELLRGVARRHAAPTLSLSGAGSVGGRALWFGVHDEAGGLGELMTDVVDTVGSVATDGPGRPHVTIARVGRRARGLDLGALVQTLSVYRGPIWSGADIVLMSSLLGEGRSGAPRYRIEGTLPLTVDDHGERSAT